MRGGDASFLDLTLPDAVGQPITTAGAVRFGYIRPLSIITRKLAYGVLILCALIAIGFALDIPALYRPIPGGPATSPLTLVIVTLLTLSQLIHRHLGPVTVKMDAMLGVVVLLCLFRTGELILGEDVVHLSTTFDALIPNANAEVPPRTGINTAMLGLMLSIGLLARKRVPKLGIVMAVSAPLLPLVSLVGYIFDLGTFYGEMSLTTIMLMLPLNIAMLANYSHRKLLRPLITETKMGKIARLQLIASLTMPLGVGLLIFRVPNVKESIWAVIYIAATIWLIAALVVISARAHEKTEQQRRQIERRLVFLSMRDALTGVINRQGVAEALLTLDKTSMGVILLDLDFFKQVNDTFGHAAGDAILQQTGETLRARMRSGDVVARWGGEEFLVLAPDLKPEDLPTICEDLRRRIASMVAESGAELTASIGATVMNGEFETLEDALARADTGLYMAKSRGRNMVVVRERRCDPKGPKVTGHLSQAADAQMRPI